MKKLLGYRVKLTHYSADGNYFDVDGYAVCAKPPPYTFKRAQELQGENPAWRVIVRVVRVEREGTYVIRSRMPKEHTSREEALRHIREEHFFRSSGGESTWKVVRVNKVK